MDRDPERERSPEKDRDLKRRGQRPRERGRQTQREGDRPRERGTETDRQMGSNWE